MNILECMIREIAAHWSDLLLFAVGFVALLIYHLQNRSKTKEAAALVVLQIDDLESRIREMAGYISGDQLNSVAYYESLPLMEENYWHKYKHLFVRSIDSSSFTRIDRYYDYAIELRDQQMLLKQIQKDGFAATQTSLANLETMCIASCVAAAYRSDDIHQMTSYALSALSSCDPAGGLSELVQRLTADSDQFDEKKFWQLYRDVQSKMTAAVNGNALTEYIPQQIRLSIENALSGCSHLEVVGTSGYVKLKKLAK